MPRSRLRKTDFSHTRLQLERLEPRVLLTTTATASGSWHDPGIWDNGVPDAANRAIIASGLTVSLDGTDHIAKELVIQGTLVATEASSDPTQLGNGKLAAYVDGNLIGTTQGSQLWTHSDTIGIGGVSGTTLTSAGSLSQGNGNFGGTIDSVLTYNRVLSAQEIANLNSNGQDSLAVTPTGEIASAWYLDGNALDTAVGDSISDNGTLVNGAAFTADALSLDGVDDLMRVAASSDLGTGGVFPHKSLSLYFKADSLGGTQIIYEQGNSTRGFNVYLEGSTLQIGGWNTPAGESDWDGDWISFSGVQADTWHHVVLTLDGDAPDPAVDNTKTLTTDWIHVNSGGVFQIGTASDRYDANQFVVTLTGDDPTQVFNIEGAGSLTNNDAFLMSMGGGRLQFFGEEKLAYSKLAATVEAGATQILVADVIDRDFDGSLNPALDGAVNWKVGDEIVIASSSYNYNDEEVRTITAISKSNSGVLITLDSALDHRHYGEIETYGNGTRTWDIDMRAEVALLNRTVQIQGVASQDTDNFFGDRARFDANLSDGFGGHIMIMGTAGQTTLDSIRFDRMGQTGRLGRYPVHWHVAKDRSGDILRGSSITNSNNRGVTVHTTSNLLLEDNVLHDIHGHGFFMEEGVETGNKFLQNITLGIHTVGGEVGSTDPFIVDTHDTAQQIDNRFLQSAAHWITNPDNTWIGNVSAGAEGTGFWFILPDSPIGVAAGLPEFNGVSARTTNLLQFDHNSSHSSPVGLTFDRGSDIDPGASNSYNPPTDPIVNYFTGYKHDGAAIYHRAPDGIFNENRFADSATSTFNTFSQEVHNTLFVGHSRGNADLSQPVTGHTLYDGPSTVIDSHFAGFAASNAHTFRANGGTEKDTHHMVSGISFEDDGSANHVSISDADGDPNFNPNASAAFSSVLYDIDGSLTGAVGGGPGSTVVPNVTFMHDRDGSDFQPPGWNAWVTDNLYAELFTTTLSPNNPAVSLERMEFTSPHRSTTTTGINATRQRISTKLDDGFYSVSFPDGLGSMAAGFKIRLLVDSGTPATGSTMLRYVGIGQSMTPDDGIEVGSWEALESATQNAYYRADDNLWLKRFIGSSFISILPNGALVPATTQPEEPQAAESVAIAQPLPIGELAGTTTDLAFDVEEPDATDTPLQLEPVPLPVVDQVFDSLAVAPESRVLEEEPSGVGRVSLANDLDALLQFVQRKWSRRGVSDDLRGPEPDDNSPRAESRGDEVKILQVAENDNGGSNHRRNKKSVRSSFFRESSELKLHTELENTFESSQSARRKIRFFWRR